MIHCAWETEGELRWRGCYLSWLPKDEEVCPAGEGQRAGSRHSHARLLFGKLKAQNSAEGIRWEDGWAGLWLGGVWAGWGLGGALAGRGGVSNGMLFFPPRTIRNHVLSVYKEQSNQVPSR